MRAMNQKHWPLVDLKDGLQVMDVQTDEAEVDGSGGHVVDDEHLRELRRSRRRAIANLQELGDVVRTLTQTIRTRRREPGGKRNQKLG